MQPYTHWGHCTGKLNGWGFVQFESPEAAERACQLTEVTLMGRYISSHRKLNHNSHMAHTACRKQGYRLCPPRSSNHYGVIHATWEVVNTAFMECLPRIYSIHLRFHSKVSPQNPSASQQQRKYCVGILPKV